MEHVRNIVLNKDGIFSDSLIRTCKIILVGTYITVLFGYPLTLHGNNCVKASI